MSVSRPRWHDGFTLLEVIIASFLLVFVVASTGALLLAATTQGTVSLRATEAAALAQQELEVLRDMAYDDVTSAPPVTRRVRTRDYVLQRAVTANDPAPNMKRIRITVSWTARGPRTYVVETVFTNLTQ